MIQLRRAFTGIRNVSEKYLPEILVITEVLGVAAVGYFSARGALEAEKRIAEYQETSEYDITIQEKIKISAPCYIPAVCAGLGTAVCMLYGRKVNAARLGTALAATATAEKALSDNREAVQELFKKKGLQKVDTYVNEKHMNEYLNSTRPVYETGHGTTLCCETFLTGMKFHASPEWVYKCVNDFNEWINNGEDPCMNDFLSLLIPLLDPSELPAVGENLRMRIDPNTNRINLMKIQLDSALTETGEPYLMFTQQNPMETRYSGI